MRHIAITAALACALAASGCSSQEARLDAASASVKATLQEAGLKAVAFQSVTGDGTTEVTFSGVTAKAGDGGVVAIKRMTFRNPDLDPMVRKWTDVGPVEPFGWTLYGGYAPKPKGFRADSVEFSDVRFAVDGSPYKSEAKTLEIRDYDSTRPGNLRYSGYSVEGLSVGGDGEPLARVSSAEVETGKWVDGLRSPMKVSATANVSVRPGSFGLSGPFAGFLPQEVSFSLEGVSDVDLGSGEMKVEGRVAAQGLGEVHASAAFGGVSRDLVALLSAKAPEKPAAAAKPDGKPAKAAGGKGKPAAKPAAKKPEPPPEPEPDLLQRAIGASSKVTFDGLQAGGSGLEWLGGALDAAYGGREAAANAIIPVVDAGFRGPDKSDRANVALGGIYLFLLKPSAFSLGMTPAAPIPFGPLEIFRYATPGGGLLDDAGFSFSNLSE